MKSRKMHHWMLVFSLLAVFAISALSVPMVMAQSADTGALAGTIKDPSGSVIPNAEITATNKATAQSRTVMSGADGSYKIVLLPPGQYQVKVGMAGFQTAEFPSVTINVTETDVLNCTLEIGVQSETVTVHADAEILQTATSTLGTLVDGDEVAALPLTTRNYTQVLDFSAGVSASVADATTLGKGTQKTSVNGSDPSQNNYQMDGAPINSIASLGHADDQNVGAGIGVPNPDALQEFKVQTSTYDASYGRNPGANVNVVTKSGSNELHGTGFFFLRDTSLNANPFFYNQNRVPETDPEKPILDQKQYGFTLGGPAIKDKLMLFGSWQGTRQTNGLTTGAAGGRINVRLPPIPEGDRSAPGFVAALGQANCGFDQFLWPFSGANVECDGSNISPVTLNILNLKLPDGSYYFPGSGTDDYAWRTFTDPARYEGDQFLANADYLINTRNTLSGRFFFTRDPHIIPLGYANLPGNPMTDYYSNTNVVGKLTSFISNRFTNEARISYQRNWGDIYDDVIDGASPAELGINDPNKDNDAPPWIVLGNSLPSMFNSFRPAQSIGESYQYADQIAWSKGNHTIRAGFEYERVRYFSTPGAYRGYFNFQTFNDFLVGGPGNIFWAMTERGDGPKGEFAHDYRQNNASAFIQDDWKISANLTLNLGLRWEYNGMLNDTLGNLTNIWPDLMATVPIPPTGPTTSGDGFVGYVVPQNNSSKYPIPDGVYQVDNNNSIESHPPYTNFGPRIGFAWQPTSNGKLVVRGGFGMFYDRVQAYPFVRAFQESPPYAASLTYWPPNSYTLEDPYPDIQPGSYPSRWSTLSCDPDGTNCTGYGSELNAKFLYPDVHVPLTYQYNVGIQYEFARNWVLDVAYVSSHGTKLMNSYRNTNLAQLATPENPINGQTANTTGNVGLRVPHIGFAAQGLQGTYFNGNSNYHSLQAAVRKAFSYGLSLQASYTFSKNLTNLGGGNDPLDLDQAWGPTGWNRPHRFILNYRYQLPFGTHQGAMGKLLNGWSVTGITTIQNGTALTFTDNGGTIYGASTGRAQMCEGATYASIPTSGDIRDRLTAYWNRDAFCSAPTGGIYGDGTAYGNSGVGIARGPGQSNWDISIIKDTVIREGHRFQFRTEFYNAFNTSQFGNPGTSLTQATFGEISSTTVNPRIIQFGFKYIF
jgi:hypothetical protein